MISCQSVSVTVAIRFISQLQDIRGFKLKWVGELNFLLTKF